MNLLSGITPDAYKAALRHQHALRDSVGRYRGMDAYQAAREAALAFWPLYERVNRDFCPEDPVYSATRSGVSVTIGNDIMTFSAVASRQFRLLELIVGSEGTTSAAQRHLWQVSTGGTTGGGGLTPEKFLTNSPTSMFTSSNLFTTWSAQPSLSGAPKIVFGSNNLGGFYNWKAAPGAEPNHVNEQVSYRASAGTAAAWSYTVIWEEL